MILSALGNIAPLRPGAQSGNGGVRKFDIEATEESANCWWLGLGL